MLFKHTRLDEITQEVTPQKGDQRTPVIKDQEYQEAAAKEKYAGKTK